MFLYFLSISLFIDSYTESRMRYHELPHSWAFFRCAKYHLIVITASCLMCVVYWRCVIYYTDLYEITLSPIRDTLPAHLILLHINILIKFWEECRSWNSSLCNFVQLPVSSSSSSVSSSSSFSSSSSSFSLLLCPIPLSHLHSNSYSCDLSHIFVLHMAHFPTQIYCVST